MRVEFENPWSKRNKYCGEMENRCVYVVIFFDYNKFSFEIGFSLQPPCHTKQHDKYIFTHPPT